MSFFRSTPPSCVCRLLLLCVLFQTVFIYMFFVIAIIVVGGFFFVRSFVLLLLAIWLNFCALVFPLSLSPSISHNNSKSNNNQLYSCKCAECNWYARTKAKCNSCRWNSCFCLHIWFGYSAAVVVAAAFYCTNSIIVHDKRI